MKIVNPWAGYINRSYQQLKISMLTRLKSVLPEMTDHTESNPLIVLGSMFSGMVEHINYYIDSVARELFVGTARKYSSLVQIAKTHGYNGQARIPSIVSIKLQLLDGNNQPQGFTSNVRIQPGTVFRDSAGAYTYRTKREYTIPAYVHTIFIEAYELSPLINSTLGSLSSSPNQKVIIPITNFVEGSFALKVNSDNYERVTTFAFSRPTDKHYVLQIEEDGYIYVIFGNGVRGNKPSGLITISYQTTRGALANGLLPGTITESTTDIPSLGTGVSSVVIENIEASYGGANFQDIESLRQAIPLHYRTLERAITYNDYYDLLNLMPSILKGDVSYCCENDLGVVLYCLPHGGGLATQTLLDDVSDYFENKKCLGHQITTRPVGQLVITLEFKAYLNAGYNPSESQLSIKNKILTDYSFLNMDINDSLFLSDIIAQISSYQEVNYIRDFQIRVKPFGKKEIGSGPALLLDATTDSLLQNKARVDILIQTSSTFLVRLDGIEITTGSTGATITIPSVVLFVISPAAYVPGDEYSFTCYPDNKDLEITDFTIPVVKIDSLFITTELTPNQLKNKNC